MSFRPDKFVETSGFDITDGGYLVSASCFVVPDPKSNDPEKQQKIDNSYIPTCTWRLTLLELDENGEVIDPSKPKTLDLKFGDLEKVRPADEPSDDINDGDATRGAEGRYAVPNSFEPHKNSKAGFFANSLQHVANLPVERMPENESDSHFLVGYKLKIRPKPQPGVTDRKTGKTGEAWNHYEAYDIIEDPAANQKVKKTASKPTPAATKTAAKPAAQPAATAAKKKPAPAPEPEPEEPDTDDADTGNDEEGFDAEIYTTEIITAVVAGLKKKGQPVSTQSVKVGCAAKFAQLPADQQKEVKTLLANKGFVDGVISALEEE